MSSSSNTQPRQPQRVSMSLQDETAVQGVAIIVLTFLAPVPKECRCLMCEHLMRDPCHVSCCGARYCQKCVDRLIAAKHRCMNRRCQRKGFQKVVSREDIGLANIIASLQVYCPMKVHGCQWTGRIRDLETHLRWGEFDGNNMANCRFLPVPCPKQCGESVPRRQMEEHCQVACSKRSIRCPFCSYEDIATVVETIHQPLCHLRVVECPSGCGMPGIKSTGLPHHLKEECPLRLVPCEHMGCEERFCLKDRAEHNKQRFHEHFQLMSEKVVALSRENEELRSLTLSVQNTCDKLQEQYRTLVDLLVHRDEEDYLPMTGSSMFPTAATPPPLPIRDDKPDNPPSLHSRTDSMRRALASFSENSGSDLPASDGEHDPLSDPPLRLKKTRPVSQLPPRFSELVPSSLASSSLASSPDFTEVNTWKNILPLPPRSSKTLASPLVGPPAAGHQISSPQPDNPSTDSPASYELPTGTEQLHAVPPPLPPHPMESPPAPPVPPSPSRSPSPMKQKKFAPPPPPRRDSLSSASFRNPTERRASEPAQEAQPPSFHISMPNLLQDNHHESCQHHSRTWSTSSSSHGVDNTAYSRNNSISQRYETNSSCDRVSLSSDLSSNSSDSQFTDSLDSTLKASDIGPVLRRQCKSVDIDSRQASNNKITMSRSTEALNRHDNSTTYVNARTFARVRAVSMNGNLKDSHLSGVSECDQEEDSFTIECNPVYIRSPAPSLSHGSNISHHTLVVSGP